MRLTIFDRVQASSTGEQICADNTDKHGQGHSTRPPSKQVSNHIDLLVQVVVGPERNTAQAKRPLDRIGSVRVFRCQTGIVLKHENLEFDKFLDKASAFCLFSLNVDSTVAEICTRSVGNNVVKEPISRSVLSVFVTVDFLLAECPGGQGHWMCPKENSSWHVHKFEVGGKRLSSFALVGFTDLQLEQRIVSTSFIVTVDGGELLVGGHSRRCNIVREKQGVGVHMQKLDDIVVSHNATSASLWEFLGG